MSVGASHPRARFGHAGAECRHSDSDAGSPSWREADRPRLAAASQGLEGRWPVRGALGPIATTSSLPVQTGKYGRLGELFEPHLGTHRTDGGFISSLACVSVAMILETFHNLVERYAVEFTGDGRRSGGARNHPTRCALAERDVEGIV